MIWHSHCVCPFNSPSLTSSSFLPAFILETFNGFCVLYQRWHVGCSRDPWVRRGYQSPLLRPCGITAWNTGGSRSNTGTGLGSSGSWHAQRWVCWGQRMILIRDQANALSVIERTGRKRSSCRESREEDGLGCRYRCYHEVKRQCLSDFIVFM